eukprot:COSAG02_NODE_53044_length_304_cov_0.751220_1_plen_29_part_10
MNAHLARALPGLELSQHAPACACMAAHLL